MVRKIEAGLSGLEGRVIAVLGLAFKQGTDDIRESSSIPIILEIIAKGGRVKVFDPQAMTNAKDLPLAHLAGVESSRYDEAAQGDFGTGPYQIMYGADEYDVARGADALVILTEWNQFRHLDLVRIAAAMRGRHFFDFRNIYEPGDIAKFGFTYEGVGRPASAIGS